MSVGVRATTGNNWESLVAACSGFAWRLRHCIRFVTECV